MPQHYQLEITFQQTAKPVFCRARFVPFALLDELNQTYDAGIAKGIWEPTSVNEYGTPVVPIRKRKLPGRICVCGDYSKLSTQDISDADTTFGGLGGRYGYTKIDLAVPTIRYH